MENNEQIRFDSIDPETIKRLGGLLRRWAVLIILVTMLSGMLAFVFSILQTPIYEANIQVMISKTAPQSQAMDLTQALNGQQLAQTYVELLKQAVVRETVSERLQTQVKASQLSISLVANTQIINISAEDPIPARAEAIANMLVAVLIERNNAIEAGRYVETESSQSDQIAQMEQKISDLQDQINARYVTLLNEQKAQLETQISDLETEIAKNKLEISSMALSVLDANQQIQFNDLQTSQAKMESQLASYQQAYSAITTQNKANSADDQELTRLEKAYNLYQQIYLNLLNSRENLRLARLQGTPNVVKLDTARAAPDPIRPQVARNTVLGLMFGLVMVIALIIVQDFLDDTIKTRADVKRRLGLSVIGAIAEIEMPKDLLVGSQPRSPASEAFRSLRSNLEFAAVDKPIRSLLITSAGPGEGKSTVATNLAGILAQSGKKVLLVDGDFRRPKIHNTLDLSNHFGMTDLFRKNIAITEVMQPYSGPNGTNFQVITTGAIPPNPSELLGSNRMKAILQEAFRLADVVIIDSPPAIVTDAQVLTALLDGVILVLRAGETQVEPARVMIETLKQSHGHILGVVLNGIQRQHGYYGDGGSYNGYDYYGTESGMKSRKSLFSLFRKKR